MEIGKDMFVILEYTLRLADGSFVRGSEEGPVSMNFVVGYEEVLPALERRLLGLQQGVETELVIPAREAFGEPDPAQVRRKTFAEFPQGRELEVGKWIVATEEFSQAQYSYYVKDKTDRDVVLDFNHPLAGKDLHYRIKVVHVRPALKEELEYLRPCGQPDGQSQPAVSSLPQQ